MNNHTIMPSTAKQAETIAYESVCAKPFTRVHGRPTRKDYKIIKEEASALASKVEDITYAWSRDAANEYGLLADIIGFDKATLPHQSQRPTIQPSRT